MWCGVVCALFARCSVDCMYYLVRVYELRQTDWNSSTKEEQWKRDVRSYSFLLFGALPSVLVYLCMSVCTCRALSMLLATGCCYVYFLLRSLTRNGIQSALWPILKSVGSCYCIHSVGLFLSFVGELVFFIIHNFLHLFHFLQLNEIVCLYFKHLFSLEANIQVNIWSIFYVI